MFDEIGNFQVGETEECFDQMTKYLEKLLEIVTSLMDLKKKNENVIDFQKKQNVPWPWPPPTSSSPPVVSCDRPCRPIFEKFKKTKYCAQNYEFVRKKCKLLNKIVFEDGIFEQNRVWSRSRKRYLVELLLLALFGNDGGLGAVGILHLSSNLITFLFFLCRTTSVLSDKFNFLMIHDCFTFFRNHQDQIEYLI